MKPSNKRLPILLELLKVELFSKNPSQNYIDDLKISIADATHAAKYSSEDGYRMVG